MFLWEGGFVIQQVHPLFFSTIRHSARSLNCRRARYRHVVRNAGPFHCDWMLGQNLIFLNKSTLAIVRLSAQKQRKYPELRRPIRTSSGVVWQLHTNVFLSVLRDSEKLSTCISVHLCAESANSLIACSCVTTDRGQIMVGLQ